jgi:hypothetical protein
VVIELSVYRNQRGELFYRTSATAGRSGTYRVAADSIAALERWLRANGFHAIPTACAA